MTECVNLKSIDKNENEEKFTFEPSLHEGQLEREDLAPDGGWGWMIVAGMIIASLVTIAQGSSFGLIYGDFLDASGNGGSALTVLNLMIMMSFSISGLICNELLKRYSIKSVGVAGALIYAIPNTLACFAPNVTSMAISFFAQGLGIGITMTVCNISFNSYFVKRRTKVMGATQAIIGFAAIIYPLLAERMLTAYGFRGCVALMGAMSFNAVVSMYVMDPVEKHYKKPKIIMRKTSVNEGEKMLAENGHPNPVSNGKKVDPIRRHSIEVPKEWDKNRSVQSLKLEAEYEKPLLIEALKPSYKSQTRSGSRIDIEMGLRSRLGKGSSLDFLANRLSLTAASSMTSINAIGGLTQIAEMKTEMKDEDEKKKSIGSILADFFEVSLLRDGIYLNMSIGCSLALLSDMLFTGFLPMIMDTEGYTKSDVALTLTMIAVAELIGKILFTVFAMFFRCKARYIFLWSVYCMAGCRFAFLYTNTLTSTITVNGLMGLARSWSVVSQTLVVAEHFKIEKFPAAWALFTVINGCNAVIFCPLIGFVKDMTESYMVTQYVLLGGLLLCAVPWSIEMLIYDIFKIHKTTEIADRK